MRFLLPPILMLALLTGGTLYHAHTVEQLTDDWISTLEHAAADALRDDWDSASECLSVCYADWQNRRTYLRITINHATADAVEAMYHRATAFAETQEISEFHAELADLRTQLQLLADAERFHLENIL